jgi:hypothetical protein
MKAMAPILSGSVVLSSDVLLTVNVMSTGAV